jgi:Fe2+ transport system protein FeoA
MDVHTSTPGRHASPAEEIQTLYGLRNGEARVIRVDAEADDAVRLMALGICVGRRVQVVKPGDPMIVRVMATRIGLSARLAASVIVATADAPANATTAA